MQYHVKRQFGQFEEHPMPLARISPSHLAAAKALALADAGA
jgi:hypothetical protein